jgi:hypothetical protein
MYILTTDVGIDAAATDRETCTHWEAGPVKSLAESI